MRRPTPACSADQRSSKRAARRATNTQGALGPRCVCLSRYELALARFPRACFRPCVLIARHPLSLSMIYAAKAPTNSWQPIAWLRRCHLGRGYRWLALFCLERVAVRTWFGRRSAALARVCRDDHVCGGVRQVAGSAGAVRVRDPSALDLPSARPAARTAQPGSRNREVAPQASHGQVQG